MRINTAAPFLLLETTPHITFNTWRQMIDK